MSMTNERLEEIRQGAWEFNRSERAYAAMYGEDTCKMLHRLSPEHKVSELLTEVERLLKAQAELERGTEALVRQVSERDARIEGMKDAAIYHKGDRWYCPACEGENIKIAWRLEDRKRAEDNFEHDPNCVFG